MTIILKNKETLIYDDFCFKCCVGKNGITKNKFEGDKKTPKGTYYLGNLYFRKDVESYSYLSRVLNQYSDLLKKKLLVVKFSNGYSENKKRRISYFNPTLKTMYQQTNNRQSCNTYGGLS